MFARYKLLAPIESYYINKYKIFNRYLRINPLSHSMNYDFNPKEVEENGNSVKLQFEFSLNLISSN